MEIEEYETVLVTQKFFDSLLEYSCSVPTGTTIGKQWKMGWPYMEPRTHWFLCEFVDINDPNKVGIERKLIKICPERLKETEKEE